MTRRLRLPARPAYLERDQARRPDPLPGMAQATERFLAAIRAENERRAGR